MRPSVLLAALLVAPHSPPAPSETASAAICQRLGDREPVGVERPEKTQLRALRGCSSEVLYYGEDGRPDFTKARLCAVQEQAEGKGGSRTEDVFAGKTILMQLYANGWGGVKRDLDRATAYACSVEGAPAEVDSRVRHLQSLKNEPQSKPFDYCDDITSGLAGGFCAARDADIAKRGRDAATAGVAANIGPAARPALAALRRASAAFVDARGGEVDASGTARAQMMIDEEEAARTEFTRHLTQLGDGRWPTPLATQAQADVALNAAYRKALTFLGSKDNPTTVKPQDVRAAQRAWLAYRDAFVAFARVSSSGQSSKAVAARLTQERVKDLAGLAE